MLSLVPFIIEGVHLILPDTHTDERGEFTELFNSAELNSRGLPFNTSQVNYVESKKGVFRGFHFQISPFPQTKIVSCLKGSIIDFFVDLRPNSLTFKRFGSTILDGSVPTHSVYIPGQVAHAYFCLEDSVIQYLVSGPRIPELERVLHWKDPEINIAWSDLINQYVLLSEKDRAGKLLKDLIHEL